MNGENMKFNGIVVKYKIITPIDIVKFLLYFVFFIIIDVWIIPDIKIERSM